LFGLFFSSGTISIFYILWGWLVLLEFVAFGAVAAGVLVVQDKWKGKKNKRHYIENVFRNIGVGVPNRNKEGNVTAIHYPRYKGKSVYPYGVVYKFQLPVGMSYKVLIESKPVDVILEGMLNRDVELVDLKHNFIGVKIFNDRLPTLVPYDMKWLSLCKNFKVVIGVTHSELIFHDFTKIPHMIIGGMTRYGKSVMMKLLITQLVLSVPQSLKFHLIDLKGGLAFNRFKKLPQVVSVARDVDESLRNLKRLRNIIKKRMLYFEEKGYEDIGEALAAGESFDREIIIVDEASVLAPQSKSDADKLKCKEILEYIAQVAGGLGYNLIMCSQYPTGDVLPRLIKQNSDARISFRLPTNTASNVVLDEGGAEDIEFGMKGRAIYKTDLKRMIQVPLIPNEIIDALIEPLKMEVEQIEEEQGEGGSDPAVPEETDNSKQESATEAPQVRKQPKRDKGDEEPSNVYKLF
jgi:DNA segregation ATPase FtsK/SpoIIIE, S-DNA-T family